MLPAARPDKAERGNKIIKINKSWFKNKLKHAYLIDAKFPSSFPNLFLGKFWR